MKRFSRSFMTASATAEASFLRFNSIETDAVISASVICAVSVGVTDSVLTPVG